MQLPKIDHAVINVHYELDQAQKLFQKLGFHLTDRGYHSLGSINHLMMFGDDYLELIGLPQETKGKPPGRPEVLSAPVGINGLVFKTDDPDGLYTRLVDNQMAGDPPKSFSRPVKLEEGTSEAHFRTVTARDGLIGGGRVYFCDHKTPHLVWRDEWQSHPNGALAITEFVMVSDTHELEAGRLTNLLGLDVNGPAAQSSLAIDNAVLTTLSPSQYATRYGALASPMGDRQSLFGAIVIAVSDLSKIKALVVEADLPTHETSDSLIVRIPIFDCVLEFKEAA